MDREAWKAFVRCRYRIANPLWKRLLRLVIGVPQLIVAPWAFCRSFAMENTSVRSMLWSIYALQLLFGVYFTFHRWLSHWIDGRRGSAQAFFNTELRYALSTEGIASEQFGSDMIFPWQLFRDAGSRVTKKEILLITNNGAAHWIPATAFADGQWNVVHQLACRKLAKKSVSLSVDDL